MSYPTFHFSENFGISWSSLILGSILNLSLLQGKKKKKKKKSKYKLVWPWLGGNMSWHICHLGVHFYISISGQSSKFDLKWPLILGKWSLTFLTDIMLHRQTKSHFQPYLELDIKWPVLWSWYVIFDFIIRGIKKRRDMENKALLS